MTTCSATCFMEEDSIGLVEKQFPLGTAVVYTAACPGEERTNEDALALIPYGDEALIFVVADGMGGARSGQKASALIVKELISAAKSATPDSNALRGVILNAMEEANQKVRALGVGAAATLAVVQYQARRMRAYHAGDAGALLFGQRGKLKFETVSHSPVGLGVEAGFLGSTEAMHHEERHLVTNVVGSPEMMIEMGPHRKMATCDTLVVASDGLFDNLHVEEIIAALRTGPLRESVDRLVQETRRRMENPAEGVPSKPDDLTVIAFRRSAG